MRNQCTATERSTSVSWTPREDVCIIPKVLDYLRLALWQVGGDEGHPLGVLVGEREGDDFGVRLDVHRLTLQSNIDIVRVFFQVFRTTGPLSEGDQKACPGHLLVPQHLPNPMICRKFGLHMVVGDNDLMAVDVGAANEGIVCQGSVDDGEFDMHVLTGRCRAKDDRKSHRSDGCHHCLEADVIGFHRRNLPLRHPQLLECL